MTPANFSTRCSVIVALLLTGCGASVKMGPNIGPHDDVGDAVTGSMSAPESPGINGPSTPGGPGGGGGTVRPKR